MGTELERRYLKVVKEWRIMIDSISWAEVDKLSDAQVQAYVDESIRLGDELNELHQAVQDA